MILTVVSLVSLVAGVGCYGFAGANLHAGANDERGALRSGSWWRGTGLQAAGFLAMLVARFTLPLLLVQACSSAGLAVTAVIQHIGRVRAMRPADAVAIGGVVVGLGMIAVTVQPGPATRINVVLLVLIAAGAAVAALTLLPGFDCLPTLAAGVFSGVLSGVGFSVAAIGARLVMGDHQHPVWLFWQLPARNWLCGILAVMGIVIAQIHLTRGLRSQHAAPVLGAMYLVATLFPIIVGFTCMHETPRSGLLPLAIIGLAVAAVSVVRLLRTA